MQSLFKSILAAAVASLATVGLAQAEYPDRPIKFVVPYTAGGQFDVHARLVAQKLEAELGQPVIVENKPGAGTTLGAEYVAAAKPDGYTVLMAGATLMAIAPAAYVKLNYKVDDFTSVSLLNNLPMALFVQPNAMPTKTFAEFVAYVKANPGKVNYGTTGRGVATHLLGELMKSRLGLDMVDVHYRGTAPAQQDLLGGHLPVMFDGMLAYTGHVKSGRLAVLGISTDKRLEATPEVPTFAELGFPELSVSSWAAIVVPKGTPKPIIDKLHAATVKAIADPDVRRRMIADATVPMSSTPEELDALVKRDSAIWGDLIKKLGLKLD